MRRKVKEASTDSAGIIYIKNDLRNIRQNDRISQTCTMAAENAAMFLIEIPLCLKHLLKQEAHIHTHSPSPEGGVQTPILFLLPALLPLPHDTPAALSCLKVG
jgi:hypothetical protein